MYLCLSYIFLNELFIHLTSSLGGGSLSAWDRYLIPQHSDEVGADNSIELILADLRASGDLDRMICVLFSDGHWFDSPSLILILMCWLLPSMASTTISV